MCIWRRWKPNVFEIFLWRQLNAFLVKTWLRNSSSIMSLKLLLCTRIQWRHKRIFVISWLFYKRLGRVWIARHAHTHGHMDSRLHTISRISMRQITWLHWTQNLRIIDKSHFIAIIGILSSCRRCNGLVIILFDTYSDITGVCHIKILAVLN